jgi:osmotically-inducible protein OsmY
MSTTTATATLYDRVRAELRIEPEVEGDTISVLADGDGVVTLTGFVRTSWERSAAEQAALRVQGVRAVANDLQVRLAGCRTDPEIAHEAARALRFDIRVPTSIKASVELGFVKLEGTATWKHEVDAAVEAVRPLLGVCGVVNQVVLAPHPAERDVS